MGTENRVGPAALRVLQSGPCYVWSCQLDANGELIDVHVSPGVADLTGGRLTPDTINAASWVQLVHPSDRKRMQQMARQMFSGALPKADVQYRILVGERDFRWVRDIATVSETGTGRLVEGIVMGIGGVAEGPVRFRSDDVGPVPPALMAASGVILFRADASGACTYVNERWSELSGRPVADAMGRGWLAAVHPGDVDRVLRERADAQARGEGLDLQYRVVALDGAVTPVRIRVEPERDSTGSVVGYIGAITDLSALASAYEDLHRERDISRNIIGSTSDGIVAFDREMRITTWNPAMERIAGVPASEVLGCDPLALFPFLEKYERENINAVLEGDRRTVAGRRFRVDQSGRQGRYDAHYSPLRTARGEVIGGLVVVRDTSDLAELQAQLVQSEKLALMGQLGAGIAHELNQPLTGLSMLVARIRDRADAPVSAVLDDLALIDEQLRRMARIVDNVRQLAHKSDFAPRSIAARAALDDALALLGESMRLANVAVVHELPDDLPFILADAAQLQQVFLNLLSNALQSAQSGSSERRIFIGARRDESAVTFWVEDSGAGVPEAARERIFDPFFSTKPPSEGTGLGLSVSSTIVAQHGGELRLAVGRGSGARFELDIPTAVAPGPSAAKQTPATRTTHPGTRVLIVDDEEMLTSLISAVLTGLGYECTQCTEPQTAMEQARRDTFSLAMVDLKMPTMNGVELCKFLRHVQPALPIVAMSGYVSEDDEQALLELGVRCILAKPFDVTELAAAAAAALDAPHDSSVTTDG